MGALGRAEVCPHPRERAANTIRVDGGHGPMDLCPTCKSTLEAVIAGWHGHRIGPAGVVAQVRALGYTRLDAARFLLQLLSDRLRLRVGLLSEREL